ncbi:MAG TPA: 5'/3'-nucleotidase SurE [Bacillota bacterium]|nr:5'/3'-nucleotidase SurE [Bacillota bacterium]HRS21703.1 5'/3'-nucleotidase SurE [Clostridia bacterium]HRU41863.1 5'/3'-nucleotidase SurE [Candidatus Diapherotrites archaeon]HQE65987.1 5'/3'-nucleotidase SurE [Bacillota bacterium]HQI17220.1 5'/3'-nucleotidase SurE [Bacillota bacterium]
MNILISNDDGIYSQGLYELAKRISVLGKVTVVAPDKEQSAIGHAITMHQPLRCRKIKLHDLDIDAWWVNGTPADCVKLGVETILSVKPDLIISGINDGENLGTDIIYSGTVSAAIEGSMFNIPSIALSYARHCGADFSAPAEIAVQVIQQVLDHKEKDNMLLNINIPETEGIEFLKGVKVTRLGVKKYRNNFEERKDPRGNSYYWLAGELIQDEIGEDTDIYAVRNGYVSITPIHIDLSGYEDIKKIRDWNISLNMNLTI